MVGVEVTLETGIREDLGSNFGQVTGLGFFAVSLSPPQIIVGRVPGLSHASFLTNILQLYSPTIGGAVNIASSP
jgi:hypothetical protein